PSTDSSIGIRDQTVKDQQFLPVRQSPTLVINLTKIGSTLSPEEHRLHAWGRSASRGIHNIRNLANSSIKICKIFVVLTTNEHQSTLIQGVPGSIGHWPVGFGCQPKRTFRKCL